MPRPQTISIVVIIETNDKWAFFDEVTVLFWHGLYAIGKMEQMKVGTFTSPVDGLKYSFVARNDYYKLTRLS